jgi:hypothetical protein
MVIPEIPTMTSEGLGFDPCDTSQFEEWMKLLIRLNQSCLHNEAIIKPVDAEAV